MALSFLSGDAGTHSLKEVEARAYAIEAAKKIKLARMLKQESDASMNSMFIGLDEIGTQKINVQGQPRLPKPQRGSRPNERSAPQPTPMNATPAPAPGKQSAPAPAPTGGAKLSPGGGGRARIVDSLPGGGGPITTVPRDVTKTLVSAEVRDKKIAERQIEGLLKQAEDSVEKAEQAAQENEQPSGFLQNKNLLIIGGVAIAAIAGIYFFTRKK
jgi:hypothetical protein